MVNTALKRASVWVGNDNVPCGSGGFSNCTASFVKHSNSINRFLTKTTPKDCEAGFMYSIDNSMQSSTSSFATCLEAYAWLEATIDRSLSISWTTTFRLVS